MTQPLNSVDSTGAAVPSTTDVTNPASQMDENSFLKLLVAQLKYQDPMSPTDNQQFMQEQAQFSTVEGITNLETTMKAMQAQQQLAQSVDLIGKQVSFVDADGKPGSGVVDSVSSSGGNVSVSVGGQAVDPGSIVGISAASQDASGDDTEAALQELANLLQAAGAGTGSTGSTATDSGGSSAGA